MLVKTYITAFLTCILNTNIHIFWFHLFASQLLVYCGKTTLECTVSRKNVTSILRLSYGLCFQAESQKLTFHIDFRFLHTVLYK